MAQATESGTAPLDRLKSEARSLLDAFGERAMASALGKVQDATGRLTGYVEGGAGPGLVAAVTGAKNLAEGKGPVRSLLGAGMKGAQAKIAGLFGKSKVKGGARKLKVTNIVESVDVGAPIELVYNQWTQFSQFPAFMKKVENVQQTDDNKLNWKAQVFWSHRTWEATILEQEPEDKIIWRSKGAKGHVDGAVTFHELAPNLTRIVLVLEYYPRGLFERTGNIWRAQGRRARLELKHFQRHVMSNALLHPDDVEGWRGVIHDGKVAADHETAVAGEHDHAGESQQAGEPGEDKSAGNAGSEGRDDRPTVTRRRRTSAGSTDTSGRRSGARTQSDDRSGGRSEDQPGRAVRRGARGGKEQ
jgi:uncharacterized membrane protein